MLRNISKQSWDRSRKSQDPNQHPGTQAQCQAPPIKPLADIFCVPRVASASGWPLTLWSQGQLHPEGAFALPASPISLQSTILMS